MAKVLELKCIMDEIQRRLSDATKGSVPMSSLVNVCSNNTHYVAGAFVGSDNLGRLQIWAVCLVLHQTGQICEMKHEKQLVSLIIYDLQDALSSEFHQRNPETDIKTKANVVALHFYSFVTKNCNIYPKKCSKCWTEVL